MASAAWDMSWSVEAISCRDGTSFEKAAELRARTRAAQIDRRKGYARALSDACVAVGAAHVALFASSFAGDENDYGLSACYVAEAGYSTSDRLIRTCTSALERWRVCGADLQVLGMAQRPLRFAADVTLATDPGNVNLGAVAEALVGALLGAFEGRATGYAYSLDALRGAMLDASELLQDVDITAPAAGSGGLLVGSPPNFPGVLPRYTLAAEDTSLRFHPPS